MIARMMDEPCMLGGREDIGDGAKMMQLDKRSDKIEISDIGHTWKKIVIVAGTGVLILSVRGLCSCRPWLALAKGGPNVFLLSS
jgi:hypothetical protein